MPPIPRTAREREATPEEFKAMAHPLRLRIIRLCLHEAQTNKEIAQKLGRDPATTLHHVRTLVRTGFLQPQRPRNGARGALEKPYLTTNKSWVLNVSRPEDQVESFLATVDALREEVVDAGPGAGVTSARLGLKLSDERRDELAERIRALVQDYAEAPDDPGGERYGFFVNLHRLRS